MKGARGYTLWPLAGALAVLISLLFQALVYDHHLAAREQNQLFQITGEYLLAHVSVQGGFSIYLAEFFTQFFHLPLAGAIFVTAWLVAIVLVSRRLLILFTGSKRWELIALFIPLVYTFLLCDPLVHFAGIPATFLALAASLLFTRNLGKFPVMAWPLWLTPLVWWLAGGAVLLFLLVALAAVWLLSPGEENPAGPGRAGSRLLFTLLLIIPSLLVPLIFRYFLLPADTLLQIYLSEAFYRIRILFPPPLWLIFAGFPALLLASFFLEQRIPRGKKWPVVMMLLLFLLLAGVAGTRISVNPAAERELELDHLVAREEWDAVIARASLAPPSGADGRLALALSLAIKGELTSNMFRFPLGKGDLFRMYERRGMTPMAAAEPYYHLGLVNFSRMMAMESLESTPDGRLPVRAVKRVAETFIIDGRYDLARKYLTLLEPTLFYRRWAREALASLGDEEKINGHLQWGPLRKRLPREDFYFNGDQMHLALLFLLRSDSGNRTAYEYLMAGYLWDKDFDGFLRYLPLWRGFSYSPVPLVFSEAVAYLGTLSLPLPESAATVEVPPAVAQRLEAYARAYAAGGKDDPAAMKKAFGNTYWYYLHFSDHE